MALISETWSDYDGSSIYGSYSVTSGTANELMSYAPGVGQVDTSLATPVSMYYHTDMIGTTKLLTDGVSAATSGGSVLTAFGEHVAGSTHRYGYAGAHGYQTDDGSVDAFPFMHVGHRYYDPSTGRFLQRDPLSIWDGTNVYEYVGSIPSSSIDPTGLGNDGPYNWPWGFGRPPERSRRRSAPMPAPTLEDFFHGLDKIHKPLDYYMLCVVSVPCAAVADIVMITFLVPWWAGDEVRWFECTRTTVEAIRAKAVKDMTGIHDDYEYDL